MFLEQGRIIDAERVAGSAVGVHEKGGSPSLLIEALITHGKSLARLERYGAALFAFRRAVELSEQTGNLNRAAEAALAAFHELGEHLAVAERGQLLSGRALGEDRLLREREVIRLALEQSKGRISRAARHLGVSWQWLAYTLRTRHKDLLKYRTPVRRRTRKQ